MRGWILVAVVAGCGKEEALPIDLRLDEVDPASWRVCDGAATLLVRGSVNPELAGRTLSGVVSVGDAAAVDVEVGIGDGGAFDLTVELELPACVGAETCAVDVVVAMSADGEEVSASRELTLLPDTAPELVSASAGGSDLDDVISQSADATLQSADFPEVGAVVADVSGGLAGTSANVLLCPEDADPAAGTGGCLVVGGVFDPSDDGRSAEVTAPTGGMSDLACSAAAVADRALFRLWVRIEGHTCADPVFLPMSDLPLRWSDGDCDDDGSAVPDDCDDIDPASYPGAPEVWYDGVDQGCDGGDDDDADADGHAASAQGGDDCDDTLPGVHPGATEVCDGVDNDCVAGGAPGGAATIFSRVGNAPLNTESLALALAAAMDGDTVGVCPGEHVAAFLVNRDITVFGDPNDRAELVGVPASGMAVVHVEDGTSLTLRDLVIRGGVAPFGGGIFAPDPASLTLDGCEVSGNQASQGGGLYVTGGQLTLVDTVVADNQAASSGGGLEVRGPDTSVVLDVGTVIERNTSNSVGGGLGLYDVDLVADPTVEIRENEARSAGGGVYGTGVVSWYGGTLSGNLAPWGAGMSFDDQVPNGDVRVAQVIATGNVATEGGGGLEFESTPTLSLDGVVIDGNQADEGGGVMLLLTGPATFNGAEITNNGARAGGGVAVLGDTGITVLTTIAGSVSGNVATEVGGGLEIVDASVALGQGRTGTSVHDNEAGLSGGGVSATSSTLSVISADILRNTAADGGGLALDTVDAEIIDGVVHDNVASGTGPSLRMVGSHVRLDGRLDVLAAAATPPGVAVGGEVLIVCADVLVQDTTQNLVEQRALTSCYDTRAGAFTVYTAPDCNTECN